MIKKPRIKKYYPPEQWKIPVIILMGILSGLSLFALRISKAHSYLSDKPETCVNCHIMAPQYATWNHSAHREVAHCNDCHVPHNNIFNKFYFKAKDGLRHASVFTLRNEPQVIFIKREGREVVQMNCIRCHEYILSEIKSGSVSEHMHNYRLKRTCWECHRETPHGRVNSISSVPDARVPVPESPVPEWLMKRINPQ
ncbi:MAG: cytochrome c nitrite reductase small subunit [Bacteroidales bacterium]|jgi:cytochrome c nitrite reductase small subunit